ncbi:hypothetical protein [Brevundimonas aveniformis]|uniref:hypothetical protein n=1 Tax=Brevundimonas aveniformis TaxID=370977 RepID=UPI0024900252|nr:hypothetical protein [Brevundimonas aveniformis]
MPEHMVSTLVVALMVLLTAGGVYLLVVRRDQQSRARLAVLAELRGWQIAFTPSQLGRGDRIQVTPEDGDWSCEVVRYGSVGSSGVVRSTEFSAPEPTASRGLTVIGPPLSPDEATAAQMFMSTLGAGWSRALVERLLGGPGFGVDQLALVDAPDGGLGTFFSTPDAGDLQHVIEAHAELTDTWGVVHGALMLAGRITFPYLSWARVISGYV